jgi:hypothetical protein
MSKKKDEKLLTIIKDYFKAHSNDLWVNICTQQHDLYSAIGLAARSTLGNRAINGDPVKGDKHRHQYHLPLKTLDDFSILLQQKEADIKKAQSFEALIRIIHQTEYHRIGPVCVYDTAVRIGAWMGLEPKHVYLHAGTLEGYKNLIGKDPSIQNDEVISEIQYVDKSDLPTPFQQADLTCDQIEGIFCIYKDCLAPEKILADCPTLQPQQKNKSGRFC